MFTRPSQIKNNAFCVWYYEGVTGPNTDHTNVSANETPPIFSLIITGTRGFFPVGKAAGT